MLAIKDKGEGHGRSPEKVSAIWQAIYLAASDQPITGEVKELEKCSATGNCPPDP